MHATGLAHRQLPPGQLRIARNRLLDWLADSPRLRNGTATSRVIFDAQQSQRDSREENHRGIRVQFAFRQTADDLIESLILAEPRSSGLVVVSNDGRLHESARRRGFRGWSCQSFTDWLIEPLSERPESEPDPAGSGEKPIDSAADRDEFLRIFETPLPEPVHRPGNRRRP